MRILLTNIWLTGRTGTEVVTIEMANGLVRRGHEVVVFSPELGHAANYLRQAGICVTDRLDELTFDPDVIHGNHSVDLVHGLIRFPRTPSIFVCHNPDHWICSPPDLLQIRAYVSVSRLGRDRIERELPRTRDNVQIVHNAVDLERYGPREALPARPSRALALTKYSQHLPILEEACHKAGLQMDVVGPGIGLVVDDLSRRLKRYDLVFATGRMALEAMAVGCAVIIVDALGLAGLATSCSVRAWRDDNFGKNAQTRPVTVTALLEEISRYDASDAAIVAQDVRKNHALDHILSVYERIYDRAIRTWTDPEPRSAGIELSRLMRSWLPLLDGIPPISNEAVLAQQREIERLRAELAGCHQMINSRTALARQLIHAIIRGLR